MSRLDEGRIGRLRGQVGRGLFPAPAEGGSRLSPLETAVVIGAFLVIATALSVLRLGSSGYQTIWAEDGPVYLQAALGHGFWHALVEPYAGYLVMGPRLIGALAAAFPIGDAAVVIAIVSALFAGLSGVAVWYGTAGHVRDPYLRGGLVIATALAATSGQEVLDSGAYVPWFTLFGTFWLLFLRPKTWWGAGLAALFVLLTGLSTPGVWFFLPVAGLRICSLRLPREKKSALVLGGWLIGGLVQIPVILGQEQGSSLWSRHIWTALVQRVIDGGIFGEKLGGGLWDQGGWKFLTLLCVLCVVYLAWGLWRGPVSARWFVALALPTSFIMFILSVYQRTVGPNIFWSPGTSGGTASRYVLVPALVFLSALIVTLDGVIRDRARKVFGLRPQWLVAAAVGLMLLAVAVSFDMGSRERPYWHEALRSAADKCIVKGEEGAGIATDPPPFGVYTTCSEIESWASTAVRDRPR